jgi:hypothetical protein
MFQIFKQPQSFVAILKQSIYLFRSGFIKALPWTVLIAVLQTFVNRASMEKILLMEQTGHKVGMTSTSIIILICNFLIFLILACLVKQFLAIIQEKDNHFTAILTQGLKRGIIALISYIVFLVVMGIVIGLLIAIVHFFLPLLFIVGIVVGLFLIWLSVRLFAWFPLIINGNSPIAAFKHSFAITKSQWWRTFGILLVVGIIVTIISTIIASLTGMPSITAPEIVQTNWVLIVFSSAITAIFLLPWGLSVVLLQMDNLQLAAHKEAA